MELNNKVIIGASIIAAVLLVVVGVSFLMSQGAPETQEQATVALPGYLEKSVAPGYGAQGVAAAPAVDVISFADDGSGERIRLLSVSGQVTKSVAPDQAEVTLSVETLDKSAQKSQADNAEIAERVRAALAQAGIAEEDIKTTSYNLYEEQRWNELTRQSESIGFRTVNSILVTVKDLDSTGSVIDAAVDAGANSVSGVRFTLSREVQDELLTKALGEASQNARDKAESIATGLGVSLLQVYSASENSGYSYPTYYKSYDLAGAESVDARAPTPITPGDVEFSASVSVQFEIA